MIEASLALLLQEGSTGEPTTIGVVRFFIAFFLILSLYIGALTFTWWISKDE
jgi:hypothetical protein